MKKFRVLILSIVCVLLSAGMVKQAQAQVYFSENFNSIWDYGDALCDATTTPITYTELCNTLGRYGWTGDKIYPAWGKLKLGSSAALGWIQTPPINCSADSGRFIIRFDAKAWDNASEASSLRVLVNGNLAYTADNLPKADCDLRTYTAYVTGGTSSTYIRFEGAQAAKGRFYIDNISVEAVANQPDLIISGITDFRQFPIDRPVSHELTIFGHNLTAGDSTTITISGNEFAATKTKLSNDDIMSPTGAHFYVTFVGTTAGSYESILRLTNTDISQTASLTASCFYYTEVSTIAQLRTLYNWSNIEESTTGNIVYKYTGEAVITCMDTFEGKKVIQDSTAAIFIYDKAYRITETLHPGDKITGIYGVLANYHGYLEFKAQANIDGILSSYNDVTPLQITLDQLNDKTFMDAHQAELISLRNVSFLSSGIFTTGPDPDNDSQRLTIRQNGQSSTSVYTLFRNADYIGDTIPRNACNIIGFSYFTAAVIPGYDDIRYDPQYYIVPSYFTDAIYSFDETACNSYTWNDSTYTESGQYQQTFTGADGIDSTVTLNLTIIEREVINIDTTLCQNSTLVYEDLTIPTTEMLIGPNADTIIDSANCRVIYLNVTITPQYMIFLNDTVVVGHSYTENGFNIPAESNNTIGSSVSVLYLQTTAGCDSSVVLSLEIIPEDTTGLNNYALQNSIRLYPNPTDQFVNIEIDNELQMQQIECFDGAGKLIASYWPTTPNALTINTQNWKSGFYFVKIHTNQGIYTKKLIIR